MLKSLEKKAHNLVKGQPWLKDFIKFTYQLSLLPLSPKTPQTTSPITNRPRHFFGYYDLNPWSQNEKALLAQDFSGRGSEHPSGPLDLVLFTGSNWTEKQEIGETLAWNWQQGCRLQWMGSTEKIVFNNFLEGTCVGVVLEPDAQRLNPLPHPVDSLSPDGTQYSSFCFESLTRAMPAYGYAFKAHRARSNVKPDTLVVARVSGGKTIIQESDLPHSELGPPGAGTCYCHSQFSPLGGHLIFIKRKIRPRRAPQSEMFHVNLTQGRITKLPFQGMISHYCFLSETQLLAYARTPSQEEGFFELDLLGGTLINRTAGLGAWDAHPHFNPKSGRLVFDSYPDRLRQQSLWLTQDLNECPRPLARLYSPLRFRGDVRVDLHPRLSPSGAHVCFDSSFCGIRSLSTMPLSMNTEGPQ